jgi:hypothetical protein
VKLFLISMVANFMYKKQLEKKCEGCCNYFIPKENRKDRITIYCSIRCSKLSFRNPNWKGDAVGYIGIHNWVERNKPKPSMCEICGSKKRLDAANISQQYKRDINDWEWICRKCHMNKDGRIKNLKQYSKKQQ